MPLGGTVIRKPYGFNRFQCYVGVLRLSICKTVAFGMDVYDMVDHRRWIDWWGMGVPKFQPRDMTGIETVTFEAESSAVGSNWEILQDDTLRMECLEGTINC